MKRGLFCTPIPVTLSFLRALIIGSSASSSSFSKISCRRNEIIFNLPLNHTTLWPSWCADTKCATGQAQMIGHAALPGDGHLCQALERQQLKQLALVPRATALWSPSTVAIAAMQASLSRIRPGTDMLIVFHSQIGLPWIRWLRRQPSCSEAHCLSFFLESGRPFPLNHDPE